MEDSFKRKVNQSLLKHGLLALYNRKVTLDLASSWKDTCNASTESKQILETAFHNRPGFAMIGSNEFLMSLLNAQLYQSRCQSSEPIGVRCTFVQNKECSRRTNSFGRTTGNSSVRSLSASLSETIRQIRAAAAAST